MNKDEIPTDQVGESNFESEVLRSHQPVLVAFLAAWSRPCQVLQPALDEVAAACAGRVKVVTVDADDNPGLGFGYAVQFIPTLLFFLDGTPRGRLVGTASTKAILSELQSVLHGGDCERGATPREGGKDEHR